jgi:hypothetical protein
MSENGKACRRFFSTKTEAEKFILETKRNGLVDWAELAVEEKHVLGVYEHVANDPMGTLRPLDNWGVNNEVLSTELFQPGRWLPRCTLRTDPTGIRPGSRCDPVDSGALALGGCSLIGRSPSFRNGDPISLS